MKLKGKRGLFFVGQPHHMRLWKPVLERLKKEGMEILYVTTHTFFPFEMSALKYGISPLYIEDLLDEKDIEYEEEEYKRLSRILSERHRNYKVFNLFSPNSITKTLRHIIREVIAFEKLLEREKIDVIFALHELNRWSKLLAYLSFRKGIPFITLQEGAYYIKHFSLSFHTEYSTANLVWGQQTVDLLRKLGNAPEKNIIVGDTHLDWAIPKYKGKEKFYKKKVCKDFSLDSSKPLIYLIQGSGKEFLEYPLGAVLALMNISEDFNYILKIHPTAQRNYVDDLREKYEKENFKIVQNYDSYDILAGSDVCVTLGLSTLTFEAFAFKKPVLEIEHNKEDVYFANYGVAPLVKPQKLTEEIEKVLKRGISLEIKKNIERWLEYVFYKFDCKATERVVDVIKFILREKGFYSKKKAKPFVFKNAPRLRYSFNVVVLGNVNLIAETLNRLLDTINPEIDEINLVFPKSLRNLYMEFKENFQGKGVINFYLEKDGKNSLSALYNFAIENSKGNFILLFKEGIIPLRFFVKEEELKDNVLLGAVVIDKAGRVKHLGVTFEHNNVVYRLYEDVELSKVPVKSREFKALDYVIFGSRETFRKVGKFDERISDYYSMIDFTLSAHYAGIRNILSDKLIFGMVSNLSFQPLTPYSHVQFYTKWRGKTEYNLLKYTEEDKVDIYELYNPVEWGLYHDEAGSPLL